MKYFRFLDSNIMDLSGLFNQDHDGAAAYMYLRELFASRFIKQKFQSPEHEAKEKFIVKSVFWKTDTQIYLELGLM
jgi:hypothetical protein